MTHYFYLLCTKATNPEECSIWTYPSIKIYKRTTANGELNLEMLFINIVYGVQIRSMKWFGDAPINFDNTIEPELIDHHQFFLSFNAGLCQ